MQIVTLYIIDPFLVFRIFPCHESYLDVAVCNPEPWPGDAPDVWPTLLSGKKPVSSTKLSQYWSHSTLFMAETN